LIFFAIIVPLLHTTVSAQDESEYERLHREADLKRQKLKQKFFEKFSHVLPGSKLIRYYQIESKLDAVKRYFWTSGVQFVPLPEK